MRLSDNWAVRQRFEFIEQRLFWEGQFNRSDVSKRFGISPQQVSSDVSSYLEGDPTSVIYDSSLKVYVPGPSFAPRVSQPDARKYLSQLLQLADDAIERSESWLGTLPDHDAIARVRRRLDVSTLRPVVLAIHRKQSVEIRYQSMRNPEPEHRSIAPHALAFDGFRWHARAWCYRSSSFKDFLLARILDISSTDQPSGVSSKLDRAWNEYVTLRLAPNPSLSEAQKKAIALDYDMKDGEKAIVMRAALSPYFERHLCLDLDVSLLPEARQQIVFVNREEVRQQCEGLGLGTPKSLLGS